VVNNSFQTSFLKIEFSTVESNALGSTVANPMHIIILKNQLSLLSHFFLLFYILHASHHSFSLTPLFFFFFFFVQAIPYSPLVIVERDCAAGGKVGGRKLIRRVDGGNQINPKINHCKNDGSLSISLLVMNRRSITFQ
jgi:hypothetical protein